MGLNNLTEEDLAIIRNASGVKCVNLSIGNFYIKKTSESNALNELIAEKIAQIMEINCAKYCLVSNDFGFCTLLSEDLNNDGVFKTMHALDVYNDSCSLYDLWFILEKRYGHVTREVYDLVKVYIFDILFSNIDRHGKNIGILFDNEGNRKITILDNELILECDMVSIYSDFQMNKYCVPIYEEFEQFFKESSCEYIDLFVYYFRLFTPEYFEKILDAVEKECGCKFDDADSMLYKYQNHYKQLLAVIEPLVGVSKVRKKD